MISCAAPPRTAKSSLPQGGSAKLWHAALPNTRPHRASYARSPASLGSRETSSHDKYTTYLYVRIYLCMCIYTHIIYKPTHTCVYIICICTYIYIWQRLNNIGLVTGPGCLFATGLVSEGQRQRYVKEVGGGGGVGTATNPYFESQPHIYIYIYTYVCTYTYTHMCM